MDGTITIGTKLDTDKFDRQISALEKKIDKEESKKIIIETKLQGQQQELENAIAKTDELADAYQRLKAAQETVASGNATPEQFTTMQDLQNTYGTLEQIGNSFDKSLSKQDAIQAKVEETKIKYEQVNSAVSEYKQKIEGIKMQKHVSDVENLKNGFSKVGSSIQDAVKKAGNLVLGIFAVRSAYLALRQASSYLATYDKQYAANLEYIKYALTQAIAPVLQWIVGLAAKLLGYINAIMQAWFGINIFSRASAKSFEKMKKSTSGVGKSMSGASKAAKEIRKTLAGFDEMNILGDNTKASGGGGGGTGAGGGFTAPSFDLSGLQAEPPKWLQWIINHKDEILAILAGIAAGLIAWKAGIGGLMSLGIGVAVAGIVLLIKDVIKFIKNPSWKNFAKVLRDISIVLTGVGIAMVAFNATNPVGWIILAVAAITGLISVLINARTRILSTADAQERLNKATKKTKEATDEYVQAVDNAEQAEKDLKNAEEKHKLSGEKLYEAVKNGTLTYDQMTTAQKEVYKAYLNNQKAQEDLDEATLKLTDSKHNETMAALENKLAIADETKNYKSFKQAVVDAFKSGKISAEDARDLIEKAMGDMSDSSKETFTKDLPKDIKTGLDPNKYSGTFATFTRKWNKFINGLKSKIKITVDSSALGRGGGFSGGGGKGGGSGGGGGRAKGGIFYPSKFAKLATGGIVNVPGRGMPYNGAIIGERGAEAVVPLTDSNQMELLGEAIGRYITVNANITNTMNGRVISRQLQQIRNEQNFAYNRS